MDLSTLSDCTPCRIVQLAPLAPLCLIRCGASGKFTGFLLRWRRRAATAPAGLAYVVSVVAE